MPLPRPPPAPPPPVNTGGAAETAKQAVLPLPPTRSRRLLHPDARPLGLKEQPSPLGGRRQPGSRERGRDASLSLADQKQLPHSLCKTTGHRNRPGQTRAGWVNHHPITATQAGRDAAFPQGWLPGITSNSVAWRSPPWGGPLWGLSCTEPSQVPQLVCVGGPAQKTVCLRAKGPSWLTG